MPDLDHEEHPEDFPLSTFELMLALVETDDIECRPGHTEPAEDDGD